MKEKLTVLIADDHPVVREGLSVLLSQAGMKIVGHASDGDEAVEKTLAMKPDLVLLDLRMPVRDGLCALEQIRAKRPGQRVVVLTAFPDRRSVIECVRLGANDFLPKDAPAAEILEAIENVCRGERPNYFSPLRRASLGEPPRTTSKDMPLTKRELDVLTLVAQGRSNPEVAAGLGISRETVKDYIGHIIKKLDVEDRTQAAVCAVKAGVV